MDRILDTCLWKALPFCNYCTNHKRTLASYWNAFLLFQFSQCYRPQMKFAKVMFSQVSVCPQRECLPHCMLGYTPVQTPPPEQTPPCAVHAGIGQQAGGAHPTGMHYCIRTRRLVCWTPFTQLPVNDENFKKFILFIELNQNFTSFPANLQSILLWASCEYFNDRFSNHLKNQ